MMAVDKLNHAQRGAVTEGDGYALVLAGAGSGKTRVIVERLAWLVAERGVNPRNLLALTFTNRAAGEMRERVAQRAGVESAGAWVGTFHSFGAYMLRRHIDRLDRPRDFTIFDTADQLALMKRLLQDMPAAAPGLTPRQALTRISRYKQGLHGSEPLESNRDLSNALWNRYHAALEQAGAVDFDDLLVLVVRLLDEHEDIRARYQERFHHVLVDEYQDTNRAQYYIAKRLSGGHGNLFVVGDEDQSIYSWRGADIGNILQFERDFPEARTFRLEQNYRSTAAILRTANAVVGHNTDRLGKTLWTAADAGAPVRVCPTVDDVREAEFVADQVVAGGAEFRETAVLFRTNGQSRLLEEALRKKEIAYVVVGTTQFYARKEVKDLMAYLRLLVCPTDEVSLRRAINVPPRGLGSATIRRLDEYAAMRKAPLFEVLRDVEHDQTLPSRARKAIGGFVHLVDDLTHVAESSTIKELVETVIERTAYTQFVGRAGDKEARGRVEIVNEFVSACAQFDEREKGDLVGFLHGLALVSDVDAWESDAPAVTLMTCHSAKGLEFENVFLVGLEEGLLPHASSLNSERELEEERRLCYVAMTRARKRLTLTYARRRMTFGEYDERKPSRFLNEVPADEVVRMDVRGVPGNAGVGKRRLRRSPAAEPPHVESGRLRTGMQVRHVAFGPGTVMSTTGSGKKQRARIRFRTGKTRTFMVALTPFEIVDRGDHR